MAMTPKTIAGGRFRDFETLKLLPRDGSKSIGNATMKTAKSTGYGPIKTTNLDSMGLSNSDMQSLRNGGNML